MQIMLKIMKKFFLFAFLCLVAFTGCASGANNEKKKASVDNGQLASLVSDFNQKDGFHVIRIGSLGTSIAKSIMRRAAKEDEDVRLVSNIAEGIDKLVVIEFEDASDSDKDYFKTRLKDCLRSSELLLEAKDDGDKVSIYGVTSDDASTIRDFIFYAPAEDAVICMFGPVSMDAVGKLIEANY